MKAIITFNYNKMKKITIIFLLLFAVNVYAGDSDYLFKSAMFRYTGDGTTSRTITSPDTVDFTPDFVFIMNDSNEYEGYVLENMISNDHSMRFTTGGGGLGIGIDSLIYGGFKTVDSNPECNVDGIPYYAFCVKDNLGTHLDTGTYTGNGSDNREILSDVDVDILLISDHSGVDIGAVAKIDEMTNEYTHNLYYTYNVPATDAIQNLTDTSFVIGTDQSVNNSGDTYYWIAFNDSSTWIASDSLYKNADENLSVSGLGFTPVLMISSRFLVHPANRTFFKSKYQTHQYVTTNQTDEGLSTNKVLSLDNDGFTVGTYFGTSGSPWSNFWIAFGEWSVAANPNRRGKIITTH